ncbi:hypothetical protein SETIT_6G061500v2 [Setaria italica]|uniref:Embryo surrounding factor 1 brassicaceae domain-containing protein n=2 Tax=Setaria TaxID=4554 RepID=K3YL12_SETIT|nr:hypothetical protein SETIT_6G061500v2 [Setaria italica]TKW08958.1 hypothetical protein SEVIR_6G059300v2 [Setaria viridis]
MKRSSQGVLLLSLVLMASSAIAAPISGESIIDGGRKSKMTTIGANKAAIIHDDDIFNGCWPHDAESSNVCCTKDNLCWPSLSECAINCPCKVRCD